MKVYLSRLTLRQDPPTKALMPLLNPREPGAAANAHHRLIWSVFSDGAERKRDFLWRYDGHGRFYTLSHRRPWANDLFNAPETKLFDPVLQPGDRLQYTLRANATKDRAVVSRMAKAARRGMSRRVDVVMDLLRAAPEGKSRADIRSQTAQIAAEGWMTRQGSSKGFQPRITVVQGYSTIELGRRRREGATFGILDLTGEIAVADPDAFVRALVMGFGRAKAWGCGLMLIRRAW